MCAHRTISPVIVVAISFSPRWSDAGDFSRTSVDAPIQAGDDDAIVQGKIATSAGPALRSHQRGSQGLNLRAVA